MTKSEVVEIVGRQRPIAHGIADDRGVWDVECGDEVPGFLTRDHVDTTVALPCGRQLPAVDVLDVKMPAGLLRIGGNPVVEPRVSPLGEQQDRSLMVRHGGFASVCRIYGVMRDLLFTPSRPLLSANSDAFVAALATENLNPQCDCIASDRLPEVMGGCNDVMHDDACEAESEA